jgi:hypothetical protein
MDGIISWVTQNWDNIIAVYLAIVGLASVIVKLTPTLKDDNILLGIVKFIAKYLALNTNAPVERPK